MLFPQKFSIPAIVRLFLTAALMTTAACGGLPAPFEKPAKPQTVTLKVINWNLWHGLGQGFLKREELEPVHHKERRFQEQIRLLKTARPDLLFLQELNPVAERADSIAQSLGMNFVFQETNCGMSFLKLRLPVNLNTGIAVLAKPPLQIKKITGLKLSGPAGFCSPLLSFQYAEFRYALFALAFHPKYGSFLLANTHFHHGAEHSAAVQNQIQEWTQKGILSAKQKEELENAIENSNQRRKEELNNIFSKIQELRNHYGPLPLILAGDLNSSPSSAVYKKITEEQGLKDSASAADGKAAPETLYTWNPEENRANHKYTEKFGVSVPVFSKQEIQDFFKKYDRRKRRIDYIFVSPEIQILSHSLFGHAKNSGDFIASDHFGVEIQLQAGNSAEETHKTGTR